MIGNIVFVGLCYLCLLIHVAKASCVYGDDCLFPCRCLDKAECNSDMGACSECKDGFPRLNNHPYRFKWGGPACQIGNVAYNKATNQSGVYGGLVSSKGVDGLLGSSSSQSNCAHPDNDNERAAWFYVDLESVHQIYNVTIYNTFNPRVYSWMVDFSIRVGNTSDVDEHAECAHYGREAVIPGGDVTLDCSARGRYVSFRREGGEAIDLVAICEFVVIGHPLTTAECPAGRTGTFCLNVCDAGSFGVGCSEECGHCKNDLCSAVDGRCSDGCETGFLGDRCNEKLTDCDVGFFGVNCDEECGRCQNSACSVVGGHCLDGCQTWFVGDLCKQEIVLPSLRGLYPGLRRVNSSAIVLSWSQDSQIPDEHSQYYGYTAAFAVGSAGFQDVSPNVAHDSSITNQIIISNIHPNDEYHFKVRIYREMDGRIEYGWPSEAISIQLPHLGQTGGVPAKWKTIATAFSVLFGLLALAVVAFGVLWFYRRGQSKNSNQGCKRDDRDAGQSSATRNGQASTPAPSPGDASYINVPQVSKKPVDESSRQYEALDDGRPKDDQDPYTAIEGVYQDINDTNLA